MHDRNGKSIAIGNTRTRFQRTADARFFHGRVRSLDGDVLVVSCLGQQSFVAGDKFAFNVYCSGTDLFFFGIFTGRAVACPTEENANNEALVETEFSFSVASQISQTDCQQEARYFPRFMTAEIEDEDKRVVAVKVVDVSDCGLAVCSPHEFKKGTTVQLQIFAYGKTIPASAEVRYCVRDRSKPGYHRIGLKLCLTARIDEKRWQQVVNHLIDQSRIQTDSRHKKDSGGDWIQPVLAR